MASALAHAHAHGIIHLDLKPQNVLLDREGNAYLADFGLAYSLFNDALLEPDKVRLEGSVPYLSPKAARGECEGPHADIYGFGALLYEMLTGRQPYAAKTREELLHAIRQAPPTSVHRLNPNAPASLARIANRAMQPELRDRYADMSYVVADLERAAEGISSGAEWNRSREKVVRVGLKSESGALTTVVLFLRRLTFFKRDRTGA